MKTPPSANKYDRIFRENIEPIFLSLVERSLGISITHKKVLPDKIITTTEREVDSLYEIEIASGKKLILHIEIQTSDDKNMVYRVSEYHSLILKKYKLPIKHIVIYLGEKQTRMKNRLKKEEIFTHFELLSLSEMNTKRLLKSNIPEEVLLAILSQYKKEESVAVIQAILIRLGEVCDNRNHLKKFTTQLTILSKLRNLEKLTVNNINKMTKLFDIRTSVLFQEGQEYGEEKGLKQGIEQGKLKNQLITIANMLTKSDLSNTQIADLINVEELYVLDIKKRLENKTWSHPNIWTDEEWTIYFEATENNDSNEDSSTNQS